MIAVDTDTRTLQPHEGAGRVAQITREILRANPKWIYKKTDSVLRGNVRAEIEAILGATGFPTALYIPANPSKGRIIRNGVYHVGGVPLAETSFANDPHHPRKSSDVLELLWEMRERSQGHITIPDVESPADLAARAAELAEQTLPAGGVEFFRAMLEHRLGVSASGPGEVEQRGPILFICGSPQACINGRLDQFNRHQIPVSLIPGDSAEIAKWPQAIERDLRATGRAAAAIGEKPSCNLPPAELAVHLAKSAVDVLRSGFVSTVCIEGGATAAAVLQQLACTRLAALPATTLPGTAKMQSDAYPGLTFLVKPGSYPWPDAVFSIGRSSE